MLGHTLVPDAELQALRSDVARLREALAALSAWEDWTLGALAERGDPDGDARSDYDRADALLDELNRRY